jgi:protein-S-isoprenylcysteine O-methyltransferase Ste14
MATTGLSPAQLKRIVVGRLVAAMLGLGTMFFLPAGTFLYWEAWLYLAVLFAPTVLVAVYLLKKDPELLERRLRMREKEAEQKLIIRFSYLYFLLTFLLPGFDKRFGWSMVSVEVVIVADIVVLSGYGIFFLVIRENRYASRVIEVEREQQVISSGPYAIVRHPMYMGVLVIYIFSPLALGSYWAIIPAVLIIPIIVARIRNEERVLARDLEGYQEYLKRVRHRLIPCIW